MGPSLASEGAREREVFNWGALRLNTKRGIISLVARENQYIIAEATRTLSLHKDAVFEGDDHLCWGEKTVARINGPFSTAIDIFTSTQEPRCDHLFVPDLMADERFKNLEPVAGSPPMRFFVAVPLVSAKGLVIGDFCVVDNEPRKEISVIELEFMKDMATTIMAHLDANRAKQQHTRAERMIRGLGLYVEGKSSLREWWLITGHKTEQSVTSDRVRHGESVEQQADQQFGIRDAPDPLGVSQATLAPSAAWKDDSLLRSHSRATRSINASASRPPRVRDEDLDSVLSSAALSALPETPRNMQLERSVTNTSQASSVASHQTRDFSQHEPKQPFDAAGGASGAQLQEAVLFGDLKESFSRASNLIRESIGVEGVLFLDASVGTFGGSSTKHSVGVSAPSPQTHNSTSFATSSSDEIQPGAGSSKQDSSSQKCCGILGYSTAARSSLYMHEPSDLHLSIPESFLRRLLRQYPHGKVFNFDDDGSLSTSEDESHLRRSTGVDLTNVEIRANSVDDGLQHKRKKKKNSRAAQAKEILTILPGSRRIAFFPLWDAHKERWYAGSLVWTKDPTRILDPDEDLTYLASFGNSIMAEVSRLNALMSSQIKTSFVSSISHELRSPLHGILASVEFLQDSPVNDLQQEMVNIISSCGRTLLDTINHVLQFTKLQNISNDRERDKKRPNRIRGTKAASSKKQPRQITSPVNLSVLTEEVLAGVYFAGGLGKINSHERDLAVPPSNPHPTIKSLVPMIIVSMDWRSSWEFDIDPGAWRRLIMNIFGNALKYTEKGFVHLALASDDTSNQTSSSTVLLTVTDSGKGISKEFLNHHLYTPFVQENALAEGTGLGLSIVRHIVNELQGSIDITSREESGTEVRVSLPLNQVRTSNASVSSDGDGIAQIQKQLRGLEACLIGFDIFPSITDEPTGILSLEANQTFRFKDSLKALLKDWFNMNVSAVSTINLSNAKLNFIMESTFDEMLSVDYVNPSTTTTHGRKLILLVLCTKTYQSRPSINLGQFDVSFLQQPIGPHKLAKILAKYQILLRPADDGPLQSSSPPIPESSKPREKPVEQAFSSLSRLPNRPQSSRLRSSTSSKDVLMASRVAPSSPLESNHAFSPEPSIVFSATGSSKHPASSEATSSSSSQYVLLVEDNAINLRLLATFLRKLGVDHATAENGLIAVQQYQGSTRPFDLILMDISMPVMDGLEASRKIRVFERESKRERVPIVAITGAASESTRQEAFTAGVDRFMIKPVSLKLIKEVLTGYNTRR